MKQSTLTNLVFAIAAVSAVLLVGAIISASHADALVAQRPGAGRGEPGGPNGGGNGGTGAGGAPGGLGGGQVPARLQQE
ncbi:MAG: hypothetical protein WA667_08750 [Candidatus Nitrosopolaris sp.]